jgi:hypothetical protein
MNKKADGSSLLEAERIEQFANLALLIGVLAVAQWAFAAGFWLGVALLVLGVAGIVLSALLRRISWQRLVERLAILGMMVGLLGMFQSWQIGFYENGFYMLGISTLVFIVVSHIPAPQAE